MKIATTFASASAATIAALATLSACTDEAPVDAPPADESATWTPPGNGTAKSCVIAAEHRDGISSRTGLSTHLELGTTPEQVARRDFELSQWGKLGVHLARTDFNWRSIEPTKGAFEWARMDQLVASTEQEDAEVIALLVYGNPWATTAGDNQMFPPDDPADFGDFAAAVATRYAGRIRKYEIWNEPNSYGRFWEPGDDPVGYGALLIEAADRIHEADPGAIVSFAGVFHPRVVVNMSGPEFARGVLEAHPDVGSHLDAMSFHPYRIPFSAPELQNKTQDALATSICEWRDIVAEMGVPDLPLWITEMGWHNAPESVLVGVSEADQANYFVRAAAISAAHGVEAFAWYTFRDSGTDPTDQEEQFGLYTYDEDPLTDPPAQPKQGAGAASVFAQTVGRHTRVQDRSVELGLGPETWAYRFTGADETAVNLLWTTGAPTTVKLPGNEEASLVGLLGDTTPLPATGGAWDVEVSERPVYVVEP